MNTGSRDAASENVRNRIDRRLQDMGSMADSRVPSRRRCCPRLPGRYDDAQAAPWRALRLIGYRTLRMARDARSIGIYGLGAAAHIVTQVALHPGRTAYAFMRPAETAA